MRLLDFIDKSGAVICSAWHMSDKEHGAFVYGSKSGRHEEELTKRIPPVDIRVSDFKLMH
jgi:hypothetical protein